MTLLTIAHRINTGQSAFHNDILVYMNIIEMSCIFLTIYNVYDISMMIYNMMMYIRAITR